MPRALWNEAVLAEAPVEKTIQLEGNVYFPVEAVKEAHLRPSETHTVCPWKGTASYYDVVVDSQVNKDAAWYYPDPKPAAREIANAVAFWRGVRVEP